MAECAKTAVLLITTTPDGTATNVARRRVELRCELPAEHEGPHRDETNGEEWEDRGGRIPTLLRDENDE